MVELETDKKQVFDLMLGQLSETSKATIRETEPGLAAITAENPSTSFSHTCPTRS